MPPPKQLTIAELLKKVFTGCFKTRLSYNAGMCSVQTEHYDADERYMAVNDLMQELKLGKVVEQKEEVRVRDTLLNLLSDKSGDVSTIATKW